MRHDKNLERFSDSIESERSERSSAKRIGAREKAAKEGGTLCQARAVGNRRVEKPQIAR
jgi:hypothetical protein